METEEPHSQLRMNKTDEKNVDISISSQKWVNARLSHALYKIILEPF